MNYWKRLWLALLGKEERRPMTWREEQEARLYAEFPTWISTVNSARFVKWLEAQPYELQVLTRSQRADDAIRLLRLYESPPKVGEKP